jgi:hypothetical protein
MNRLANLPQPEIYKIKVVSTLVAGDILLVDIIGEL